MDIQQQKAKLEMKLAALRTREKEDARKRDTRQKIVIGGACISAAESNPEFAQALSDLLAYYVTGRDRELVAKWL